MVTIAEAFTPDECQELIASEMRSLCSDRSWRVRYMVAENFVKVFAQPRVV